jgi:uncharacterized protein YndB with AHSA1/START domain
VLKHELREGGVLHSVISSPGMPQMCGLFTYREVLPTTRLVWSHAFSNEVGTIVRHPLAPTWPLTLLTTVTFADEGQRTKVTLEWKPLNASPEEEATFAQMLPTMNGGWSGSFDQLDEVLART